MAAASVMQLIEGVNDAFVGRLAQRAQEAEGLRRLPDATVADLTASGLTELLVRKRFGSHEADFPAVLDPVGRMAHGCTSSAWMIGLYTLHNWMLAIFGEKAQFATRPFLAPAPLAPTGRGVAVGGIYPALALLLASDFTIDDVWQTIADPVMRLVPIQTQPETTGRKSGEPRRAPLGREGVNSELSRSSASSPNTSASSRPTRGSGYDCAEDGTAERRT